MIYCLLSNKNTEDYIFNVFQNEDILFISEINNDLASYKEKDILILESSSKKDMLNTLKVLQKINAKIVILTGVPSIEDSISFLKTNKMIRAYGNRYMSKANMLQLYNAVTNKKVWFYPELMKELKKRKIITPS
ncbi:MAG: hypothetical protein U9Q66_00945 [Patescibacteria group bacterium]|nr:hypothetical protein [Patescibacteria group bacterium]